jgi:molecular chaperone GrpE
LDLYALENEHNMLPPRDLVAEIYRLENDLINEREANLRTVADYKNYRHRIERERDKVSREGKREILFALLDIVDDMDKAVQYALEVKQPFMEGVRIIRKKFLSVLEEQGVHPFDSFGAIFDQKLHEAVAMDTLESIEPRTIIEEYRRGYFWGDELLRPAQVKVSG